MEQTKGYIYGISGPVIKVKGSDRFQMQEMVYVGHEKLIGEVQKKMKKAAAELNFEAAAELRDKMLHLKKYLQALD